jgi:hypothetical protein
MKDVSGSNEDNLERAKEELMLSVCAQSWGANGNQEGIDNAGAS